MKFTKFIVNYWGDIFFLLFHPFALYIDHLFHSWRFMKMPLTRNVILVYVLFTGISLIWVAAFRKKRKRVLRVVQYPLYFIFTTSAMLIYYFFFGYHPFLAGNLFNLAMWLFVGLAIVRFCYWLNKRQARKAGEEKPH